MRKRIEFWFLMTTQEDGHFLTPLLSAGATFKRTGPIERYPQKNLEDPVWRRLMVAEWDDTNADAEEAWSELSERVDVISDG
jgi:hypothetical protein